MDIEQVDQAMIDEFLYEIDGEYSNRHYKFEVHYTGWAIELFEVNECFRAAFQGDDATLLAYAIAQFHQVIRTVPNPVVVQQCLNTLVEYLADFYSSFKESDNLYHNGGN